MTHAIRTIVRHPWVVPAALVGYAIERAWVFWSLMIVTWALFLAGSYPWTVCFGVMSVVVSSMRMGAKAERVGFTKPFRKP